MHATCCLLSAAWPASYTDITVDPPIMCSTCVKSAIVSNAYACQSWWVLSDPNLQIWSRYKDLETYRGRALGLLPLPDMLNAKI